MNVFDAGFAAAAVPAAIMPSSERSHECANQGVCMLCHSDRCDPAHLELLQQAVKRRQSYRRGEVLFRAGDAFDFIYAVRSGSVKTFISTDDGRVQVTGFHSPGDLLGLSALANREYNSEARALESTSVCKIEAERFEELAEKVPAVRVEIMRVMSNQIRDNESLMLLLGKRTAEERLASYLLDQSRRFATRCFSATQFNLTMSRVDIGNFLGIAEETVCRILARFQAEGIIESRRRLVVLRDCERLATIAAERQES